MAPKKSLVERGWAAIDAFEDARRKPARVATKIRAYARESTLQASAVRHIQRLRNAGIDPESSEIVREAKARARSRTRKGAK